MTQFCLMPDKIDEFKKALSNREINITDLFNMTSEERTKLFETYAKENAKDVNLLFEEKLILKNRLQGIKNWVNKTTESGRWSPEKKAEVERMMAEYRKSQEKRIFSPEENEAFLSDLAEHKLGTRITREEAQKVFEMTEELDNLRTNYNEEKGQWGSEADRLKYGFAKVASDNYMSELKGENAKLKTQLGERIQEFKKDMSENKPMAFVNLAKSGLGQVNNLLISTLASVDNSFLGRQGLHTLQTHPTVWAKAAANSFVDIAKVLGNKKAQEALLADVYSRPNYLNGEYHLAKILAKSEEQFPTSLPERIPGVGRVFKASEVAFENSALRMRTGLYDLIKKQKVDKGLNWNKEQIESFGKLINSLTARGQWGKRGESAIVRLVLWAPKMLKANIDVLTAHTGQAMTKEARREAQLNLLKVVGSTATVLAIADALKPGSVEWDPRSSDFGKIRLGNTRFDVTGGASSIVTLAARLLPTLHNGQWSEWSKSSTTGRYSNLRSGDYGAQTALDTLYSFLEGKAAPGTRILADILKGKTVEGKKPSIVNEAPVPISIKNFMQLKDDSSANAIGGAIADIFGINANTYAPQKDTWETSGSKELQQFKEKMGMNTFKKASKEYDKLLSDKMNEIRKNKNFQNESPEEQQLTLNSLKEKIRGQVFSNYNFKYKRSKSTKSNSKNILKDLGYPSK